MPKKTKVCFVCYHGVGASNMTQHSFYETVKRRGLYSSFHVRGTGVEGKTDEKLADELGSYHFVIPVLPKVRKRVRDVLKGKGTKVIEWESPAYLDKEANERLLDRILEQA